MKPLICIFASILPLAALATSSSPYVGQEFRAIKALSSSEQADLLAGKGMGLAKAAELNGYPGPAHVLELAGELSLTPEQVAGTKALFVSMEQRAQSLGRQIVEAEDALDLQFREKRITAAQLQQSLFRIGELQAQLRAAHLEAHIDQTRLLSAEQIGRYQTLRGYGGAGQHGQRGHQHGHQH